MDAFTGVTCDKCGDKTQVLDTRSRADGTVKRRRECQSCKERFSTVEGRAEISSLPTAEGSDDGGWNE